MNSGLQKRLYEMEVMPPPAVWEKLSLNIDEINADNAVAKKILSAELVPPADVWEKINSTINVVEKKQPEKKAVIINLRRFAAAAIFVGIVVTAWLLIRNRDKGSDELAGTETQATKKTSPDTNSTQQKTISPANENNSPLVNPTVSLSSQSNTLKDKRHRSAAARSSNFITTSLVKGPLAVLNTERPGGKSFDQPIDDLSRVTADQHYLTRVNLNGRLVKIPAELAHLAPHLQDKPISEDIYEIMFGEGNYWKETMGEWRKKIASLPVSSGDAFTSFIELLKTVQDK